MDIRNCVSSVLHPDLKRDGNGRGAEDRQGLLTPLLLGVGLHLISGAFWNADTFVPLLSFKDLGEDGISWVPLCSCQMPEQLFWCVDSFLLLALVEAKSQRVAKRNGPPLCCVMTAFKAGHRCQSLSCHRLWSLELGAQGGGTEERWDTCHWDLQWQRMVSAWTQRRAVLATAMYHSL